MIITITTTLALLSPSPTVVPLPLKTSGADPFPAPLPNPDMITPPKPAPPVACAGVNRTVNDAICNPPEPRLTTVPATVTAVPPKATLCPPIAKPVGLAVNVCPAIVKTDCGGAVGRGLVWPFMMMELALGGMEYVVPDTMTGAPPALATAPLAKVRAWGVGDGVGWGKAMLPSMTAYDAAAEIMWLEMVATLPGARVLPATMTPPLGAIWRGWPAIKMGVGLVDGGLTVLPSMTAYHVAADTMWPEIVATFPGARVVPAIMIPPLGAIWTGWPATNAGAGVAGAGLMVLPSMTAYDAPADITWPEIVATFPGARVLPATTIPPLVAIRTGWPAINTGVWVAGAGLMVLPSMTACDDPATITWPAIVALLPGAMVVPAAMTPPFEAIWTGWPAMSGGLVGFENGTA